MNPHAQHPTSIIEMLASFWRNRELIGQIIRREVIDCYKGSVMGLAWSFLNPVFMLVVYTFVFSVVFKARWGAGEDESKTVCRGAQPRPYARIVFIPIEL